MYQVSKEKLSTAIRRYKDRLNGNSMELEELINKKNLTRNNKFSKNTKSAKTRYWTCSQLLRQRCRELKNKWWLIKVTELFDTCRLKWLQRFLLKHESCVRAKSESPRTTANSQQQNRDHREAQASCQVKEPPCYTAPWINNSGTICDWQH